jgi:hypothetical protein
MSIKDLFGKKSEGIVASQQVQSLYDDAESEGFLTEKRKENERFLPSVDFLTASNFARYGSAEKYYSDAIKNIYQTNPYDGSKKEKTEWRNSVSQLDLYVLDNIYPKTTGYVIFNSSSQQYVTVKGGPNTASSGKFVDANIYDLSKNRESNLALNPLNLGNTVEFWYKESGSNASTYALFDLWNGASSGSVSYTRFLIEKVSSGFRLTYCSGTSGVQNASIAYTHDINNWHHYAFSVNSASTGLNLCLYVDGDLVNNSITGSAFYEIANNANSIANLGAYRTGSAVYVNGAFDEFRFWKEARSSKKISRYWFTNVDGGANTDDSNTELGIYFKFNEGILSYNSVNQYDTQCLDYSGRISNGSIINYTVAVRSTGSALESYSSDFVEQKDPVVYSIHPDVQAVLTEYSQLGFEHDKINNSSIYKSIPSWITEQQEDIQGEDLSNLTQIISSYFDTLHLQIENLTKLKDIKYFSDGEKPLPFINKILSSYNFNNLEIFNNTTFLEDLLSRNETDEFEESLFDIKNTIYQNIYNNLIYIYKSKGTEKSLRNLIRCFGVDDELVKINLYADNAQYNLTNKYQYVSTPKKFVDFNDEDRFEAVVYQKAFSGDSNTRGYIKGESSGKLSYIPVTLQAEIIFPKKVDYDNPNYIIPEFTTVSLFGVHTANNNQNILTWGNDEFNFQVYAEKRNFESKDVYFRLSGSLSGSSFQLTSSWYNETYDNNKWNLAVRIKPQKIENVDLVSGSSTGDYVVEFVGFNTTLDNIDDSFILSASIPEANAKSALSKNKRVYAGAHYQDFDPMQLMAKTDVKISSVRFWHDYLNDEEIKNHSYDSSNFGREYPYWNAFLTQTDANSLMLTKADLLTLNWDFAVVTGSDSSGEFLVEDASSGSVAAATKYGVGWLGDILFYRHTGLGTQFYPSDSQVVNKEFIYSAKLQTPETLAGSDLIQIRNTDDIESTRNTKPVTYFYSVEKSMSQVINNEIINWFSTINAFNNLIGDPSERYRREYKNLSYLRKLFFEKVQNEPSFERFIEFYKWIDSSISMMIAQLVPASANISENVRNVVESHLLERNKYENKLPTIEAKGEITATTSNFRTYGNPNDQRAPNNPTGSTWLKLRAERTHPLVTSGDANTDANRETIREVLIGKNLNKVPKQYDTQTQQFYEGKRDLVRGYASINTISSSLLENPEDSIRPVTVENSRFTSDFQFASASVTGSGQILKKDNKIGNFRNTYEYFQTSGRSDVNLKLPEVAEQLLSSSTESAVDGIFERTLPTRPVVKTVIVEKFSAPGGPEVMSRGYLDAASEEFSVYNGLNNRNSLVRKNLNKWSAESASIDVESPSYHKVNKNTGYTVNDNGTSNPQYDNSFIQHQIPRSDAQYSWITASLISKPSASGYFSEYDNLNVYNSSSAQFLSASVSGSSTLDFIGLNTNIQVVADEATNTLSASNVSDLNKYLLNINGPYGNASWKQIRQSFNKIVSLSRKNNRILVQDRPQQKTKNEKGFLRFFTPRQSDTFTSYIEPPVSYNLPMTHVVSVTGSKLPIEIVSTYDNNKEKLANEALIKVLGVKERTEPQTHDVLKNLENGLYEPRPSIKEVVYQQNIFPRKDKVGTKETRTRPEYAEVAGTGSNGYDRNIAKIRSFWRNNVNNRIRTIGSGITGSINSLNYPRLQSNTSSLSFQGAFINTIFTYEPTGTITYTASLTNEIDTVWSIDNEYTNFSSSVLSSSSQVSANYTYSSSYFGELSTYKLHEKILLNLQPSGTYTTESVVNSVGAASTKYKFTYQSGSYRVIPRPQFAFFDNPYASRNDFSSLTNRSASLYYFDVLPYKTNVLSNNSPWYDSYEDFFEDIKPYSKKYSLAPEYKINNLIDFYFKENNGNFDVPLTASYLSLDGASADYDAVQTGYNSSDELNNFIFEQDNGEKSIKIKINAVKKLLPYKGFYPQERAVQVVDYFRDSFFGLTDQQILTGSFSTSPSTTSGSTPVDQQIATVLQPYFAPGVLFNTIKAGVAVHFPTIITSSDYDATSVPSYLTASNNTNLVSNATIIEAGRAVDVGPFSYLLPNTNYNFPFESLLDIDNSIPSEFRNEDYSLILLNQRSMGMDYLSGTIRDRIRFPSVSIKDDFSDINKNWSEKNPLYRLAINNFLSEIVDFFLLDGKLNNFTSKPLKNVSVISGTTYYMDVYFDKNPEHKHFIVKNFQGELPKENSPNSLHFALVDENAVYSPFFNLLGEEPIRLSMPIGYTTFAPPYSLGKNKATLSYTAKQTGLVSLKDILEELQVQYRFSWFAEDIQANLPYFMPLSASINFKQLKENKLVTYDEFGNTVEVSDNPDVDSFIWSIQTKFETPVLNFNNDLNRSQLINITSSSNNLTSIQKNIIGLWSGYGEVPKSGAAIKFGIEETYQEVYDSLTGSLIKLCGFRPAVKDIGRIASSKEISEAVVIIPYVELGGENLNSTNNIALNILGIPGENDINGLSVGNGPFYFSVNKNTINELLDAQFDASSVEQLQKLTAKTKNINNSIIKTINSMTKYNIPPHLDWVQNKNIEPFVMYIAEFKETLDQQDLADIWQGLMPKIARNCKLDENFIEHPLKEDEFFHGKSIPAGVKFKIFKVKKKAKKSYYDLTDDSSDDTRFRFDFANQKTTPDYSFNYPYDFFSLVELINIETSTKNKK